MEAPPGTSLANIHSGSAVSPDGQHIVLSAGADRGASPDGPPASLWLRRLGSAETRMLPGTEGGTAPVWSPGWPLDRVHGGAGTEAARSRRRPSRHARRCAPCRSEPAGRVEPRRRHRVRLSVRARSGVGLGRRGDIDKKGRSRDQGNRVWRAAIPSRWESLPVLRRERGPEGSGRLRQFARRPVAANADPEHPGKAVYVPPRGSRPGYLLWVENQTLQARPFDADSLLDGGARSPSPKESRSRATTPVRAAFWVSDAGLLLYAPALRVDARCRSPGSAGRSAARRRCAGRPIQRHRHLTRPASAPR